MKCYFNDGQYKTNSSLNYALHDESFLFEPMSADSTGASVTIKYIDLILSNVQMVVAISGYCPRITWVPKVLDPPSLQRKTLFVKTERAVPRGTGLKVTCSDDWTIYVDEDKGWLCVDAGSKPEAGGELFNNVCVFLDTNHRISQLWIPLNFV